MIQSARETKRTATNDRQRGQDQIRVACYTRKSSANGLEQEFTSIDAQREAIHDYIRSQRARGWVAIPESYDDGGYSGASTARPAFQRLMRDIEAGEIGAVACYKHDRLSRSFLDFYRVLETFEKHGVTFVSITQNFDTTSPIGRLLQNMLMSFAEFEREQIAERTRDKLRAATRKGFWTGGIPVIGYDSVDKKLVVNEVEAKQVRAIFDLYLQLGSMMAVVTELDRRGWKTKTHTNKAGKVRPGRSWTHSSVQKILHQKIYTGVIVSRGEEHDGQHEAIIDETTWDRIQALIKRNTKNGGSFKRRKPPTNLLTGVLDCGVCGRNMTHEVCSSDGGKRRYRYYKCARMGAKGTTACPGSRAPAGEVDQFVVDEIRAIGRNPTVLLEATKAAREQAASQAAVVADELDRLGKKRSKLLARQTRIIDAIGDGEASKALTTELGKVEAKVAEVDAEIAKVKRASGGPVIDIDADSVRTALASFDDVWKELVPEEQRRIIHLLIERIDANIPAGTVDITYRPGGIEALAQEANG